MKLDQWGEYRSCGLSKGARMGTGVRDRQRRSRIHECPCTCEPGEFCVCTWSGDLLPLLAQEEEGTWLSVLVFYVSPVCKCC